MISLYCSYTYASVLDSLRIGHIRSISLHDSKLNVVPDYLFFTWENNKLNCWLLQIIFNFGGNFTKIVHNNYCRIVATTEMRYCLGKNTLSQRVGSVS